MFQSDAPYELKHRITGALVLAGVTFLLLLGIWQSNDPTPVMPDFKPLLPMDTGSTTVDTPTPSTEEEFTSRIVDDNPGAASGQLDKKPATKTARKPALPELNVSPVLRPATQIARPSPTLNSVKIETPKAERNTASSAKENQWIVRVGAFSKKTNAEKMAKKLAGLKLPVHSRSVTVQGKTVVRVWVGPYPDQKQAVRVKGEINSKLKQSAFIARAK